MRAATSALLGALATVGAWAAWSLLAPADSPAVASAADASVAAHTLFAPTPAVSTRPPEARVDAASRAASAVAVPARTPSLRDGQVMENGLPTALHAASDDGRASMPPPAVALPAGVRPADAVVNQAGMVALTQSPAAPADRPGVDAPPRPALSTRAP